MKKKLLEGKNKIQEKEFRLTLSVKSKFFT